MSKIALPAYVNEPISLLQRFAEMIEYKECLDKACEPETNQWERIIYVAAFLHMTYSGVEKRVKKPFNPLLAETFDYILDDLKYVTEQVSHHPPVSACYGESPKYEFWGDSRIKTKIKLTGTADVYPMTTFHIKLKSKYVECTYES